MTLKPIDGLWREVAIIHYLDLGHVVFLKPSLSTSLLIFLSPYYISSMSLFSMSWLGKTAKSLFIFLFLFLQLQDGAWESITWLYPNVTISMMDVTSQVTVTVCHITKVTWGPWESKHIATVVKCISSREMSENSIEFSLSNSEQRDSWLNSSHRTLDTDTPVSFYCRCDTTSQGFNSLDLTIISHQWWWLRSDRNSFVNKTAGGWDMTSLG